MKRLCGHTESDASCPKCAHYDKLAKGLPAIRAALKRQNGRAEFVAVMGQAAGSQPTQRPTATPAQKPHEWTGGPGTEFHKLADRLGIPACQRCNALAKKMDTNGVQWCKDHRAEILTEIEERAAKLSWTKWIAAGVVALKDSLPKTPAGMLDYAIELAEKAA